MNINKIPFSIACIMVVLLLTSCGYSPLYTPDKVSSESLYDSLDKDHKTSSKQAPHRVGDNQFAKKYGSGILPNIKLNPLNNKTVLSSERIWVASIADYKGWFLRSELNKLLHTEKPKNEYKYTLKVTLTDTTSAFSSDIYGVPNRFKYLLNATYSIENFKTGKIVYQATSQAVTSYTLSRSLTSLTFSEKDAQKKALVYISTKMYTNIIAWLYNNEHKIKIINPKVVENISQSKSKQTTIKDITLYPLPVTTKDK